MFRKGLPPSHTPVRTTTPSVTTRGPGGTHGRSPSIRAARQPVTPTAATTSRADSKNGAGCFRSTSTTNSGRSPASFARSAPLLAGDRPNAGYSHVASYMSIRSARKERLRTGAQLAERRKQTVREGGDFLMVHGATDVLAICSPPVSFSVAAVLPARLGSVRPPRRPRHSSLQASSFSFNSVWCASPHVPRLSLSALLSGLSDPACMPLCPSCADRIHSALCVQA